MEHANHSVKVLQFGEGNFLRAFADLMIQRSNEAGDFSGSIAIVKPRGDTPLTQFSQQGNRYTVAVRGMDATGQVQENRRITSVSHALNPNLEPDLYQQLCLGEELRFVISNTTEAGIRFDGNDTFSSVPATYPGRVTKLLYQRFTHFGGDERKGLYLLPCELIDHNGQALYSCVKRYARLWQLPDAFMQWVDSACVFCDTLVDRIVSGFPRDNAAHFFSQLGYEDPLLTVCEPYYLWVIQKKGRIAEEFPIHKSNSGVLFVPDVTPYKERKVRLLNGAHTAMTPIALLSGKECVDQIMDDPSLRPFLDDLIDREIIPAFSSLPRQALQQFAADVKTRFRNPFLHHRWEAISLNSWSKFLARLMPTVRESGSAPQGIALALAALVELYCTQTVSDDPAVLAFFASHKALPPAELLTALLSEPVFGLSELLDTEFACSALFWLTQLRAHGIRACVDAFRSLIRIHEKDNVAVAKRTLAAGLPVVAEHIPMVTAAAIPAGHKLALAPIAAGETVFKYGCSIGTATASIAPGQRVHSHNLHSALTGKQEFTYDPAPIDTVRTAAPTFRGYLRPNGKVGVRNEIWIIPTVGCINGTAELLARKANEALPAHIDAVVALTHPYGCSQLGEDHNATRSLLAALASHPNAGGVLLLGLGCENNQLSQLLPLAAHPNLRTLICQDVDDEISEAQTLLRELMANAQAARQEIPAHRLILGIKCGGSDAFSGITANPLVGQLSDRVCGFGGSVVMGEVPEMFGAEAALLSRCENKAVFDSALSIINGFKDYYLSRDLPICENPSPGNRAGGITTLEEKSLGCTQKSGLSPITDALPYGQTHRRPGVTLLSTPGNDLVASTALAAAGCHMVLFTTGRGTPFGTCVPTVKLSTNTALAQKKQNWIDFDAGRLLTDGTMDGMTDALLQYVLNVASGTRTKNELLGDREIAIFKNGVTL